MARNKPPHQRVCDWRAKKKFTQKQVAEKLGVSRSAVAQIETGRCGITVHLAKAYADLMDCNWANLVTAERY